MTSNTAIVTGAGQGFGRPARVVDGLVTGWHEAQASHLLLLEAVAGRALVDRAYAAAVDRGYLLARVRGFLPPAPRLTAHRGW